MSRLTDLERRLLRGMARANKRYGLLAPGDKVMACVSGGKDSLGMLHLLRRTQQRVPFDFEVVAVTLHQGQPGFDTDPLEAWMERQGYEFHLVKRQTYRVVQEKLRPGHRACSLCSRLRRGNLYQVAVDLGATKLAFGHHRDDVLETVLLNLFYAGQIGTMVPRLRSDDGRNTLIRPLYLCAEEDLRALAEEQAFPILPCGICDGQTDQKRQKMKRLLGQLQRDNPKVKGNMMAALGNVRGSHLLDRDLRRAMGHPDWGAETPREPQDPDAKDRVKARGRQTSNTD